MKRKIIIRLNKIIEHDAEINVQEMMIDDYKIIDPTFAGQLAANNEYLKGQIIKLQNEIDLICSKDEKARIYYNSIKL